MGVPAFYRWLSERYPKIVVDVLEKRSQVLSGEEIPLNLLEPNPNGIEFDNLYIDMNGLIHPCSHPEDREAPSNESEMYLNVTKYVDRLFAAIRPRRLLFLAIDGVAPRAKMNQQRARRFRAAQEASERAQMMNDVLQEMEDLGLQPPPSNGSSWDSNVITPGTEFMDRLSLYIRFYILDRMNRNPAWRSVKVVFSDASEPGEGEHKIMKFIRSQRSQPGYDPNQRHVLHGLDADLIMLGLATHEAHFTILREEITFGRQQRDKVVSEAKRMLNEESAAIAALHPEDEWVYGKALQFLNVNTLRHYLRFEFQSLQETLPFPYDLERVIDDFVFLCFFVGNDFLPHLPSLDIRDGAIEFLLEVYKDLLPSMGDYVTRPGGEVNLRQVDVLLSRVGEVEDEVFQQRKAAEDKKAYYRSKCSGKQQGFGRKKTDADQVTDGKSMMEYFKSTGNEPVPLGESRDSATYKQHLDIFKKKKEHQKAIPVADNAAAADALRSVLGKRRGASAEANDTDSCDVNGSSEEASSNINDIGTSPEALIEETPAGGSSGDSDDGDAGDIEEERTVLPEPLIRNLAAAAGADDEKKAKVAELVKSRLSAKQEELIETNKKNVVDTVKLHESGWKGRYYEDKHKKEDIAKNGGLEVMLREYIKGLCWVLKYYYQGCPSWNWYYPFHYAPFASDLVNVDTYEISFELSEPFLPVEQLLAVLPAESVHALPEACQWLMLDEKSPIRDLYSSDIPIDPNGKVLPWLWVVLLPFIDERRIKSAMALCKDNMTEEETRRNTFGTSVIFLHRKHPLVLKALSQMYYPNTSDTGDVVILRAETECCEVYFPPTASEGDGISGHLRVPQSELYQFPLGARVPAPTRPVGCFSDIEQSHATCFEFSFPKEREHRSQILEGAEEGATGLSAYDFMPRKARRTRGQVNILDIANGMRDGVGGQQRMITNSLGISHARHEGMSYQYQQEVARAGYTQRRDYQKLPQYGYNQQIDYSYSAGRDHPRDYQQPPPQKYSRNSSQYGYSHNPSVSYSQVRPPPPPIPFQQPPHQQRTPYQYQQAPGYQHNMGYAAPRQFQGQGYSQQPSYQQQSAYRPPPVSRPPAPRPPYNAPRPNSQHSHTVPATGSIASMRAQLSGGQQQQQQAYNVSRDPRLRR
mmetsp:Transcript_3131/g.4838  ORF Transcript_3131/g.4838 Transcript_3131/m.4838 type:complete len:1148 (+) Transcript_3131:90-3533(+)